MKIFNLIEPQMDFSPKFLAGQPGEQAAPWHVAHLPLALRLPAGKGVPPGRDGAQSHPELGQAP